MQTNTAHVHRGDPAEAQDYIQLHVYGLVQLVTRRFMHVCSARKQSDIIESLSFNLHV